MINKPCPFGGLNIRIPILIPIKGMGLMNEGSWVSLQIIFHVYSSREPQGSAKDE